MKKKVATLIFAITFLSASAFSQIVNEKIDKQIKDPKTPENSGKADVYIQKKRLTDSEENKEHDQQLLSKKKNKRKRHCKKDSHSL